MTAPPRGHVLDRALRVFADVRPGEGAATVLLAANVFLLLTSYYLIKPVREALILSGGGAELKSYLSSGQAILLLAIVPLYSSLAGRVSRRRLLNTVTLVFAACLVLFYLLARAHVPLGVAFFLWAGIFNLMIVAQFWALANDLCTEEAGRRLFPVIAIGASSGATLGSVIAAVLIPLVGVYQLLLLASAILALSLILTNHVEHGARPAGARRATGVESLPQSAGKATSARPNHAIPARADTATSARPVSRPGESMGREGAFRLVWRNRYLLAMAFLILLVNLINTNGEYLLGRTVRAAAATAVATGAAGGLNEREYIGRFYSQFFSAVNLAGLLAQMFLVSRIVKYLGVRIALLLLPALAIGSYLLLAFVPILPVIRWAKTAENASDYSLQNTVRNMLFLPTSREEKYKAKQAIDAFFVRTGDVLSSVLVYVGTAVFALRTGQFALVNLALAVVWFVLAFLVGRRYARLTERPVAAAPAQEAVTVS